MASDPRWENPSTLLNSYGLIIGEIITAYNSGIHKIIDIQPKDNTLEVTYNQIYSIDGLEINMNRPAKCEIKYCKPAIMLLPEYKKKLKQINEFIKFLEEETQKAIKQ